MRALIVEPQGDRGTLTATRALTEAGWQVGVASSAERTLAGRSRFASRCHRIGPAQEGVDEFVAGLNRAIDECGYEIVFCGAGDAEVTALSMRRDEIAATVPYPPHETVLRALDKLELARAAERAGLGTPVTVEATADQLERWEPPMVVKPRLHAPLAGDGGPSRLEATITADRRTASERARKIRELGGVPLLQEQLSGELMAFVIVADRESRVVARCQQIVEATWPPGAGVSSRARTTAIDEDLAERVAALVRELGWFGIADIQFMRTGDGEPQVIDLNGRFYGSLALAVGAGANLPAVWAALATGREPASTADAAPGVRYQWLEGDLRRALSERRGGRVRDLADCLRYARGATHSVFKVTDPGPGMSAVASLASRGARRAATGSG